MKRISKIATTTGLLCALVGAVTPAATATTGDNAQYKANRPSCALEITYYDQVFRFPPNCEWPDVPKLNLDELMNDAISGVVPGFRPF